MNITTKRSTFLNKRGEVERQEVTDPNNPQSGMQAKIDARMARLGIRK